MYFKNSRKCVLAGTKMEWKTFSGYENSPSIRAIESSMKKGSEFIKEGKKVSLYAVSGVVNHKFWNRFKEDILRLKQEKNFMHHHIFGPLISCDDTGYNCIVESYNENSKYFIRKLRCSGHYIMISSFENDELTPNWFMCYYEDCHKPLQTENRKYVLIEKSSNESDFALYLGIYRLLLWDFKSILCESVQNEDELRELLVNDEVLHKIMKYLEKNNLDFDDYTKEELLVKS